jgi:hypothetical protein
LALVFLPVVDESPLLFCGVPYPKAAEDAKFRVRNVVRRNQEQCPTSGATPLFSEGKFPRTLGASITFYPGVHVDLIQAVLTALSNVVQDHREKNVILVRISVKCPLAVL